MKRTPFQQKPPMPSVPHMGPISNQQTQNSINQENYKTLYSKFQTSDYNELEKQDYENIDLSFKTEDGSIINAIISNDNLTETEIILLFKKFKNFSNLTPTSSTVKSIETPLHIACKKQYYTVIRYLIDNGFNRSIEKQYDSFGNLPIHYLFQNLTYDCKDNDYYQPKNFISNKQNKYKQKEINFEKLLISSIHNHCKDLTKYKNLFINFETLINRNKFYHIDEFTSIINDTQDKIKQLLIKKKLFIKEGDDTLIKENVEEISKDPEFIQILNEAQKNLLNKFDKYKIDNIENIKENIIEETFKSKLKEEYSFNEKENFKAITDFNTNRNNILEAGEQFRHKYFDDPLSLVFVYKYIYETIDTNLVDILDNKTGDNQLNVITILSDIELSKNDFNLIDGCYKDNNNDITYFNELIAYLYHHIDFLKLSDDIPPGRPLGNLENLIINNIPTTLILKDLKNKDNNTNNLIGDINTFIELLKYLKKDYSYIFKKINYDFMMNYLRINDYLRRENPEKKFEDNRSFYYKKYKKLFENYQEIKNNIVKELLQLENLSDRNYNTSIFKKINSNDIYNDYNLKNDKNDKNDKKKEKREKLKYYQEKPEYYLNTKGDISYQHFINIHEPEDYTELIQTINDLYPNTKYIYDYSNKNNFIYFDYNTLKKKRNEFRKDTSVIDFYNTFKFKFTSGFLIEDIIKQIKQIENNIGYELFNSMYCLDLYESIINVIIKLKEEYDKFIKYIKENVMNEIQTKFLEIKQLLNDSFTDYDKLMEEQSKYVNNLVNNYSEKVSKEQFNKIYRECVRLIDKIDNIIKKFNKSISLKYLIKKSKSKSLQNDYNDIDFATNKFQILKNEDLFNGSSFFDEIYSKYKNIKDIEIASQIFLKDINFNELYNNITDSYSMERIHLQYKNDENKLEYLKKDIINYDKFYCGNIIIKEPKHSLKDELYKKSNIIYNKKYKSDIKYDSEIGKYIFKNEAYDYDKENDFPIISIEYIKLILIFLIKDKIPNSNEIKNSYDEKTKEAKYAKYSKYKHFINDENLLKSLVVYYNLMLNKLQFKEIREIIKVYILTDDYKELQTKYEPLKDNKYENLIKENPIRFDLLTNETDKVNNSRLINDKCYNSNTLIENSDILKQLNILDLTKQGHNIMNILIDQMNFKAISYIIDNESSLTHNGNYVKTMKDKNNLTSCEYARNKLNIIIGQYSSNGEEINSLLSFQSKIIDEINSDEKFNIGLQKDDTIKNIIMNCFYLFDEFIWLDNKNDKIKNLFENIKNEPLIKTLNEEQIFQSNIFDEVVKEKLMDEYRTNYKTEIINFTNNDNSINYENYEKLVNVLKQDYIKIIKIVNANDIKSYSKINDLIFNNFENKMSSNLEDLKNYFNNINKKVCQTYYDLDKTINDDYNQTNMNIIEIIRLNIINIYMFEFNEIIKVYLKRINGVDYDIDNSELLKNIFYYVIVMELNLSGEETFETYENMKIQFIDKVFKENGIEIENDERLNTFMNSSMDFYKKLIVDLSKYFNKRAINYIGNLQSISILLNIIEKLK